MVVLKVKIYNNNKNKNNKNKNSLEFIYDDFKTQNFENHYLQQMQVSDDSDVETGIFILKMKINKKTY